MRSLAGRVAPILLPALVATLLAALLVPLALDRIRPQPREGSGLAYPRIEQAAGAIDLMREAVPALHATVLRALNSAHLRAEVTDDAPPAGNALRPAPKVEMLIRGFADLGSGGDLRAYTDAASFRPGGRTDIEGLPVRVVWGMPDGRFLVLREVGDPHVAEASLLGRPASFWIGVLGLAVAALALLAARQETKPLRQLAAAATAFDGHGPGLSVEPEGAPDVRRLVEAVRGMQDRVAMLLQERSFLIGAISHDLKTYLTRLRLRAESIVDVDIQARVVADLDVMTDLIETAVAFARGTTVSRRRSLVDLADLVAIEAAERMAMGHDVRTVGEDVSDAIVGGDPVALRRVLSNLVDNALKFGRGRVEISVEAGEDLCRMTVDDDGLGVTGPERVAIFSPFYRIEGSRSPRTGGSGLGLAIVRQIVEAHRGTIGVEDGDLGGARFVVALPAAGRR